MEFDRSQVSKEKSFGKDQIRAIPSTVLAIGGVGCTNFLVFNEVVPLHFTCDLVCFATLERNVSSKNHDHTIKLTHFNSPLVLKVISPTKNYCIVWVGVVA